MQFLSRIVNDNNIACFTARAYYFIGCIYTVTDMVFSSTLYLLTTFPSESNLTIKSKQAAYTNREDIAKLYTRFF